METENKEEARREYEIHDPLDPRMPANWTREHNSDEAAFGCESSFERSSTKLRSFATSRDNF